jgi:hypothetical protein
MKKIGFFIVLAVLLSNTGCSSDEEVIESPSWTIGVKLINNDLDEAHMWVTGSSISPLNKLQPGESRNATYWKSSELMKGEIKEETMTIYAGRNGVVLATKEYSISINSEWSPGLKATYTGSKIR